MQYQVTRGEKGKIEVKVGVTKAEFEGTYNLTLNKYRNDVKIAGFRPGKAPDDVVESHVGLAKILNESASTLISKHLGDIFKKEDFVPIDSPNVAVESLSKDSPFSFTSTFTLKPKVVLGDWKKIKIKKVKAKEITDADVNNSIKNIFEAWEKDKLKVKSHFSQENSLKASKLKVEEGEEPETRNQKPETKYIYDAHGNKVFFEEKKEPDTPGVGSGRQQGNTPGVSKEPNDNFAKAIGARDLGHLREIVKKDLETLVADQVEAKLEEEIFAKLLEMCQIEVPDILIDDELNRILIRLNSQLERQKKTLEDYLKEQNTTLDALKAKWRPQAEKNVRISLIMDNIGKSEKVMVSKEELEATLKNVKSDNLSNEQKADLEAYVAVSIFQAKTLDLVKKTVSS